MSNYIINIENTSGEIGSVIPDVGFSYTDFLDQINVGTLKFGGLGSIRRGLLEVGSNVEIKRDGVREFYGQIGSIDNLVGGAIIANLFGYEIWLARENGVYAGSPWTATASATIASAIIAESNYFTAGTINAGFSIDFEELNTDSLYNALSNLARKTQQDIGVDYPNLEIDFLDHKGSSTSVATLNDNIEIGNVGVSQFYPRGNIIRVIGRSEGQTKICATCCDATSISNFGCLTMTVRDRTISTNAEAAKLAEAELARNKQVIKVYDFDVNNFGLSLVSGDVITVNAESQGLSNEDVRIVGIERGIRGGEEFMTMQVANEEYSKSIKVTNEVLGEIERNSRQNEDYNQYDTEYSNSVCEPTYLGGCVKVDNVGQLYDVNAIYGQCGCEFYIFSRCNVSMTLNVANQGASPQICLLGGQTNFGGNKAVNLANPSSNQDAATKCYVDACAGGGSLWADGSNPYIVPCNSCSICVTISSSTCACASRKFRLPVGVNCY